MAVEPTPHLGRRVRRVVPTLGGDERGDGGLLELFLRGGDERAFESLLRSHGPMVFGVCRRVLGIAHDADDAFQAAFLVVVRRGRELLGRETIGG